MDQGNPQPAAESFTALQGYEDALTSNDSFKSAIQEDPRAWMTFIANLVAYGHTMENQVSLLEGTDAKLAQSQKSLKEANERLRRINSEYSASKDQIITLQQQLLNTPTSSHVSSPVPSLPRYS